MSIRLYNVVLLNWQQLKYPANINVVPPLPRTKNELLALTRVSLSQHFFLPLLNLITYIKVSTVWPWLIHLGFPHYQLRL